VTPIAGTAAAGEDFTGEPVTVSWADGEGGVKYAAIAITDDSTQEPLETFSVELSSATGGALIGPSSVATFEIGESDMPEPPLEPSSDGDGGGGGGGGRIGLLSLLLVGLVRLRRRGANGLATNTASSPSRSIADLAARTTRMRRQPRVYANVGRRTRPGLNRLALIPRPRRDGSASRRGAGLVVQGHERQILDSGRA
jgi:hypothetical protein